MMSCEASMVDSVRQNSQTSFPEEGENVWGAPQEEQVKLIAVNFIA